MPTIAELLTAHRDRTGDSYRDMARRIRDEITHGRLQQLATKPPNAFPDPRTVVLLSELLQVPVTTTVLAVAAGLGIPVQESESLLAISLPPGTDNLTGQDRDAVIAVTRALVEARRPTGSGKTESVVTALRVRDDDDDLARPPMPDMSQVAARHGESEGRRRAEEQDRNADNP